MHPVIKACICAVLLPFIVVALFKCIITELPVPEYNHAPKMVCLKTMVYWVDQDEQVTALIVSTELSEALCYSQHLGENE